MKIAPFIAVAGLAGALLACGQKGPLVMPDAQKHKRTIPSLPGAPAKPANDAAPATPAPASAPTSGSPSTPAPTDSTSHP